MRSYKKKSNICFGLLHVRVACPFTHVKRALCPTDRKRATPTSTSLALCQFRAKYWMLISLRFCSARPVYADFRTKTFGESLTKFGQFPSMDTLPAVRAALKELYVLKRIDIV